MANIDPLAFWEFLSVMSIMTAIVLGLVACHYKHVLKLCQRDLKEEEKHSGEKMDLVNKKQVLLKSEEKYSKCLFKKLDDAEDRVTLFSYEIPNMEKALEEPVVCFICGSELSLEFEDVDENE